MFGQGVFVCARLIQIQRSVSGVAMNLSALCDFGVEVRIEALVQILFQNFQTILLEMQKLDFGQELPSFHDGNDAAADDLDDFFRGAVDKRWDQQLHGDPFLLANMVVTQYLHTACGNLVCNTLVNADRTVELLAVTQEANPPVCRIMRLI
jgi:hypothetical protein